MIFLTGKICGSFGWNITIPFWIGQVAQEKTKKSSGKDKNLAKIDRNKEIKTNYQKNIQKKYKVCYNTNIK